MRLGAVVALVMLGAAPGVAQPLTTLLNRPLAGSDRLTVPDTLSSADPLSMPDPLSRPAPLTLPDPLIPTAPLAAGTSRTGSPCARPPTASLSAGGSGPGEFRSFLPPVATTAPASTKLNPPAASQPGVDRPLWNDGSAAPLAGSAGLPPNPPSGALASSDGVGGYPGTAAAAPSSPAPVMDRPLWSTGQPPAPCVAGRAVQPGSALPP